MASHFKVGPHARERWLPSDPKEILIHCRVDQMQGTFGQSERQARIRRDRYERAKRHFDMDAAMEIVAEVSQPQVIDAIVDRLLEANTPPVICAPHPEYDSGAPVDVAATLPSNAIPFAIAATLAEEFGCDIDEEIFEVARPGRSKLGLFQRFLWQPKFEGPVRRDRAYILVDDVCTTGGTFAALRSHIVAQGGTALAAMALSHNDGPHRPFPLSPATYRGLQRLYGSDLEALWIREIGHDPQCLTEIEGRALLAWGNDNCRDLRPGSEAVLRLGNRLAKAAAGAGQ
jgi:hypothetical protein